MPPLKNTRLRPVLALVQALLVGVYSLLAYFAIFEFHSQLAMSALAASAFIAFSDPFAEKARPRYFLGGYAIGGVIGAACDFAHRPFLTGENDIAVRISFSALAVFLTALVMLLARLPHPSACGLALCIVLEPNPVAMALSMLFCVVALCFFKWLMAKALLAFGKTARVENEAPEREPAGDVPPLLDSEPMA